MKCKYCKKSAGLFSFTHKECEKKHHNAIDEIQKFIFGKLSESSKIDYLNLKKSLANTIDTGFVSDKDFDQCIINTINKFLQNKPIYIDGFALQSFTLSLPVETLNKVIVSKEYCDFWRTFIETKFSTLQENDKDLEKYQCLIKGFREFEPISKSIDQGLISTLESKLSDYLEDGIIDNNEEQNINSFIENSLLSGSDVLYNSDTFQKFVQSLVLRDIQEGKDTNRVKTDYLPILLGKKEKLLWVFKNIRAYEEKTGHKYIGNSQSVSMRVGKGVYYRTGVHKGRSVEYQYKKELGKGFFIVTSKNLYFIGEKHVKIGISKVLSFEPFRDGIIIVKDGANPKPYTFVGFDPWFVINAMQLLVV